MQYMSLKYEQFIFGDPKQRRFKVYTATRYLDGYTIRLDMGNDKLCTVLVGLHMLINKKPVVIELIFNTIEYTEYGDIIIKRSSSYGLMPITLQYDKYCSEFIQWYDSLCTDFIDMVSHLDPKFKDIDQVKLFLNQVVDHDTSIDLLQQYTLLICIEQKNDHL